MLSHFSLWCSAQWKWFSGERQPISENRKKNFSLFTSFSVISCVSWCARCWYSSSSVQKVFYVCAQCSLFTGVLLCEKKVEMNTSRTIGADLLLCVKTEKWEIKRKKKITSMCRKLFLRHLIFFLLSFFSASCTRLSHFVNLFRAITYFLGRWAWHFVRLYVLKSLSRKISLNKVNESLVNS